jgi:hypothetical protein
MASVVETKLSELLGIALEKNIPQNVIDEQYPYIKMTLEAAYVQFGAPFIQRMTWDDMFDRKNLDRPYTNEETIRFGQLFNTELGNLIKEQKPSSYYEGMVNDVMNRVRVVDPTNKFCHWLESNPDGKAMFVHMYKKNLIDAFHMVTSMYGKCK